jgi:hypothetical protein
MPMSQHRRAVAAILAALFALLTLSAMPLSASAQSAPSNSSNPIVQVALKYVGKHGGQCWIFAQNVVREATGIQMGFDYRGGFLSPIEGPGAIEVPITDAQPGDIIQVANDANTAPDADYPGLHTSIIVKNNGDGTFDVVDSNFNFDETVREHDGYNPAASAARYGIQFHIYRFSSDGTAIQPKQQVRSEPIESGDQAVTRTPGDVLNLRSAPSTQGVIIERIANGSVIAVTGETVHADGYDWVPVKTQSGKTGWVAAEFLVKQAEAATSGQAPVSPVLSFHVVVPMVVIGN